jgi:hypothetical protein
MSKSGMDRKFLGKTENFESKEEQKQQRKHLTAYLRGDKSYKFGWYTNDLGIRKQHEFPVLEKLTQI